MVGLLVGMFLCSKIAHEDLMLVDKSLEKVVNMDIHKFRMSQTAAMKNQREQVREGGGKGV
jgi:hypothetical protein